MADAILNFACLDELIQLIYQGASKFVVLSRVDDDSWTVHVGLSGAEGRWWRARWGENDILQAVATTSDSAQEQYAERLKHAIINGELYVAGWSVNAKAGTDINLTFDPGSKNPTRLPLQELSAAEAAAAATANFIAIALQAQSHKCQLYPTALASTAPASASNAPYTSAPAAARLSPKRKADPSPERAPSTSTKAGRDEPRSKPNEDASVKKLKGKESKPSDTAEIARLKTQLAQAQRKPITQAVPKSINAQAGASRAAKGASLANPNKKARKVQEIEFESDDD